MKEGRAILECSAYVPELPLSGYEGRRWRARESTQTEGTSAELDFELDIELEVEDEAEGAEVVPVAPIDEVVLGEGSRQNASFSCNWAPRRRVGDSCPSGRMVLAVGEDGGVVQGGSATVGDEGEDT